MSVPQSCSVGKVQVFAVFVIFAVVMKRQRRAFIFISVVLFFVTAFYVSLFAVKYHKELYRKEAVVVTRYADCKFEPFIGATNFFTLTEGETVEVADSDKEWVKVKRFDGKQGWIKRSDIEFL